jgi:hypothetical protein
VSDVGEERNVAAQHPDRANQMRQQLYAWINSVNAQTNTPNPDFNPALFHELYEAVDVTRYVPSKANARTRAKLLNWRQQMNAVLPKQKK